MNLYSTFAPAEVVLAHVFKVRTEEVRTQELGSSEMLGPGGGNFVPGHMVFLHCAFAGAGHLSLSTVSSASWLCDQADKAEGSDISGDSLT